MRISRLTLVAALTIMALIFNSFAVSGTVEGVSNTKWKIEANERIEKYRKSNAQIKVVDNDGNVIPNIKVNAEQITHAFGFGTAISDKVLEDEKYATFIKDNFEWAVFENESKQYHNEKLNNEGTKIVRNYEEPDKMLDFCEKNNIKVRGHCLFWESPIYTPYWIASLSKKKLAKLVDDRLASAVNHYKGRLEHWDVLNETMNWDFFRNSLGNDIIVKMHDYTRKNDPNVKLYVNDYNTIEGVNKGDGKSSADDYRKHIEGLIKLGTHIDGIGVQGHFKDTVDPVSVYANFESLAPLKQPILVTEYDSVNSDENKRADNLEALYRTALSHPSVEGVMMWGFWAGKHWRGANAAIVNLDWTLNEAGKRYFQLMEEWTTKYEGTTDVNGLASFRGFHGKYKITLTSNDGKIYKSELNLDSVKASTAVIIKVDQWKEKEPDVLLTPTPTPTAEKKPTPKPLAVGTTIFTDNFSKTEPGKIASGWTRTWDAGLIAVAKVPGKSTKRLEVVDASGSMGSKATRAFTPVYQKFAIEFSFSYLRNTDFFSYDTG